ncbi:MULTISPECIES: hypothetical protein [unclassified Thermosipho (in: thermotogales)]|uniref:hypothetical protein n=1 Tax=unclassified Thermosipho (in: thermotogales) TaxID=2676525 RepID=UPI0009851BA2|nr:hypothetical protein [Thermosipho sp. 1223]MBT1247227.1 hypothetical protein [Thermosipho sp. 1244]OOC47202.1 hypothetical protein XO09_02695 [Thermosipho sp. 1223]
MKKTILVILLISLSMFSLNIPRYIGKEDVYIEFEGLLGFFDGIPITENRVNGLDFEDGAHSLRLVGSYQEFLFKIIVDTVPPTLVNFSIRDPNLVIFKTPVYEVDYNSRLNFFEKKLEKTVKRYDVDPLVVCGMDDAGNVGNFIYIPPSVENITPLDSKTPISGIFDKNILLSSKSPYKIVGKILVPEKSALLLEKNVELKTIGVGNMVVKGTVYVPKNVNFTGNLKFEVEGNGTFYLEGREYKGEVSSNGGKLVFLKDINLPILNLSKTNLVVIKDSTVDKLNVEHVGLLVLENSTITNLNIANTRKVIINKLNNNTFMAEGLTNMEIFSLSSQSFNASDFSRVVMTHSNIEMLSLKRGTYFHGKENIVVNLNMEMYSIAKIFNTSIKKLELIRSKVFKRLSNIENTKSDKFSSIENF